MIKLKHMEVLKKNKIMKTINFYQNMRKKYYRIKEDSMETV